MSDSFFIRKAGKQEIIFSNRKCGRSLPGIVTGKKIKDLTELKSNNMICWLTKQK